MEERENTFVPYCVHEGMLARMERTIKRLWILCIVLIVLFVGTNGYWIWYESQWTEEVITQEITQDSGVGGMYRGYSRTGDTMQNLERMMDEAQTEQERDAIRRVMEMM